MKQHAEFPMKILAFEFSSSQRSIAILNAGVSGPLSSGEIVEAGPPPVKAFAMIEEVLRQAQLEREQVECLAIGIGPGSYSGIRSAIALAQGWQLALPVKVVGISSVECLAAHAHEEGIRGSIQIAIDAQRNEFYLAGYDIGDSGWVQTSPLCLAGVHEVRTCAQQQNGASATRQLLIGPEVEPFHGRILFPRATTLARLALGRKDFVPANKIEPIYLRETSFVKAPAPRTLPQ